MKIKPPQNSNTQAQNPLVIPILDLLKQRTESLSEYDIIQHLAPYFDVYKDLPYNLKMFKTHFLTMNALYYLQEILVTEGFYVSISALEIQLEPILEGTDTTHLIPAVDLKLRTYYLDWQHYDETQSADVDALLDTFWHRYNTHDQHTQALATLELPAGSSWTQIQHRYRQKANAAHPDKGGSRSAFIDIRKAYEVLKGSAGIC